jgi:hypothetical protein
MSLYCGFVKYTIAEQMLDAPVCVQDDGGKQTTTKEQMQRQEHA